MTTIARVSARERSPIRTALLAFILIAAELAIFFFGSPYFAVFPTNKNPVYGAALVLFFGLAALVLHRLSGRELQTQLAYALFIAAAANLVLIIGPFNAFITANDPVRQVMQDKLAQFASIVPVILILTGLSRHNMGWIFLQRGRVKRWLLFGSVSFAVWAILAIIVAMAGGITTQALWRAAPYVLVFVAANSVMEELWFRAIFLRPYSMALGGVGAVLVTSAIFAVTHVNATYIEAGMGLVFGVVVLMLGLVTAWCMRWADSLWGAVLFHMGADLMIILPILNSL